MEDEAVGLVDRIEPPVDGWELKGTEGVVGEGRGFIEPEAVCRDPSASCFCVVGRGGAVGGTLSEAILPMSPGVLTSSWSAL